MDEIRPIGLEGDPILRLQKEVDTLKKEVQRLKTRSRPTIPIYAPETIDSLTEDFNDSEHWINANNGAWYFYFNGAIHKVTST